MTALQQKIQTAYTFSFIPLNAIILRDILLELTQVAAVDFIAAVDFGGAFDFSQNLTIGTFQAPVLLSEININPDGVAGTTVTLFSRAASNPIDQFDDFITLLSGDYEGGSTNIMLFYFIDDSNILCTISQKQNV
jgi:hypothetical protein